MRLSHKPAVRVNEHLKRSRAVDSATLIIVSDEAEFSRAVTGCWQSEGHSPSFLLSRSSVEFGRNDFDIAIVGGVESPALESVLHELRASGKPVIHLSRTNGSASKFAGVIQIAEETDWRGLLVTFVGLILERQRAHAEVNKLCEANVQLAQQASLGRYILEMRHNLNNALTSILGNSELVLLDAESLPPCLHSQVETIRNMGLRMNEIMKRFSSLQKEMQLAEDQGSRKAGKSAAAGA
jgi:signal transduction histidine kinase